MKTSKGRTFLSDAIDLVTMGSRALENDDFSECFKPVPQYQLNKSGAFYGISFFIRYFVLFPIRLCGLIIGSSILGIYFLLASYTESYNHICNAVFYFFKLFMFIFNCNTKHIGVKQKINEPHVYVSNHSSFIDFMILSSHRFCHACIAENHGGLYGFIFAKILSKIGCIAFKRSDKADRETVVTRIRQHIEKKRSPMLIFPEGTCVNNKSVVLFQKGAFELGVLVCPVAIKYTKEIMDPYWNRRVHSFGSHLFYLMTRWRTDAEVHWLEPTKIRKHETPIQFSHRIKNLIAKRIGLKNTLWNGAFKSSPVLKDREIFKDAYKLTYVKQKCNLLGHDVDEDLKNRRNFLAEHDSGISVEQKCHKFFNSLSYEYFVTECCKEYLRLKENYSENKIKSFLERAYNKNAIRQIQ